MSSGCPARAGKQWLMGRVGRRQAAVQRARSLPRFGLECLHRRTGPGFVAGPHQPLGDGWAPLATACGMEHAGLVAQAPRLCRFQGSAAHLAANGPAVLPALWAGFRQQERPICTFPGPFFRDGSSPNRHNSLNATVTRLPNPARLLPKW